jgi:hypothetical protein
MVEQPRRLDRPSGSVESVTRQCWNGRVEDSSVIADAHQALLCGMRDGRASGHPRELLISRCAAWADDLAAWPLVNGLLHFSEQQVHETSSAVRNGTYDDREWLREQRVLSVVMDLYDDIRRAVLVRQHPNSGVRAPHALGR